MFSWFPICVFIILRPIYEYTLTRDIFLIDHVKILINLYLYLEQ